MRNNADLFAVSGNPWVTEADRCEMAPMPPSKAHLKRFQRDRGAFCDPARPEDPRRVRERRVLALRQRMTADRGGSLTVAPTPEAERRVRYADFSTAEIRHNRPPSDADRRLAEELALDRQIAILTARTAVEVAKMRGERAAFEQRFADAAHAYADAMEQVYA